MTTTERATVVVRMPLLLYQRLKASADQRGLSMSGIIRDLVKRHLARAGKPGGAVLPELPAADEAE